MLSDPSTPAPTAQTTIAFPHITITYCTQCKWMLRAAYFAQELLSTFSVTLGSVTLVPSTGGTFVITIETLDDTAPSSSSATSTSTTPVKKVIWDRTVDGGFPEIKELKRQVRDVVEPERDLGHNDRVKKTTEKKEEEQETKTSCVSGDCK